MAAQRQKLVKISIIIPVINEANQVSQAIVRAWKAGADEVIVADGGSSDATAEIAAQADCQVIRSESGRGVQMNAGASHARGDVLLFLHADNGLAESVCEQIRVELPDSGCRFGAFEQRIENDRRIYRWIERGNALRVRWQGLIYGDQAFFIKRNLFQSVGGFPEICLMEDFAFSQKLKSVGKPLLLPGPTLVNARRWEGSGPVRQTIRNWWLATAYRLGATPEWIARRYRRHDD